MVSFGAAGSLSGWAFSKRPSCATHSHTSATTSVAPRQASISPGVRSSSTCCGNPSASSSSPVSYTHLAANEVGVNLKQGYNGDLTSKQAGSIGGQMVKKMVESYENSISSK